jgi:hypothetical protein
MFFNVVIIVFVNIVVVSCTPMLKSRNLEYVVSEMVNHSIEDVILQWGLPSQNVKIRNKEYYVWEKIETKEVGGGIGYWNEPAFYVDSFKTSFSIWNNDYNSSPPQTPTKQVTINCKVTLRTSELGIVEHYHITGNSCTKLKPF